jgi:hypothetical protein
VDAAVLVVVHDHPHRVRSQLLAGLGDLPFPVLVNVPRRSYAAWGLRRAPWWRVWLDPQVWRRYARLLLAGERIRGTGRDTLQLEGDFVVAADGTIAYARPQRCDDRPRVGVLVRTIEELATEP